MYKFEFNFSQLYFSLNRVRGKVKLSQGQSGLDRQKTKIHVLQIVFLKI